MDIVITGASKGMGKALAVKFAQEGNNIFICARNKTELAKTANEIKEKNTRVLVEYFATDLSDRTSLNKFTDWLSAQKIKPGILINNAGRFIPGSICHEPEGALEQMIANNLYSAYHITRALLPSMMKEKKGHIFNMCSIAALKAYSNGGSYSISKYALMGLGKNLRDELMAYNIKVTTVYPGAVYTSSWKDSGVKRSRIMEAKDIVDMIYAASLLSPKACVEDIIIRPQLGDLP